MRALKRTALALTVRFVVAATLVAGTLISGADVARADATIEGPVVVRVDKGRRFVVEATVRMSAKGTVTVRGSLLEGLDGVADPTDLEALVGQNCPDTSESAAAVGDVPEGCVSLTKRFKFRAGKQVLERRRTIRFVVEPRKVLGRSRYADALVLAVEVIAREEGQVDDPETPTTDESQAVSLPVRVTLPPPLMIIPGTTNELTTGALDGVMETLQRQAGSPWLTRGRRATLAVVNYRSLSRDLDQLGNDIAKRGSKMLRRSPFTRCDIVAHSLGGLVARQAMRPASDDGVVNTLRGRVRQLHFLGVPQSGAPVAFLAEQAILVAIAQGVDPRDVGEELLANAGGLAASGLGVVFLQEEFIHVVRWFLPGYDFISATDDEGPPLTFGVASGSDDLNASAHDEDAAYFAVHYLSATGAADGGTVTGFDVTALLAGLDPPGEGSPLPDLPSLGDVDLTQIGIVFGPGDGVVPVESMLMQSVDNPIPSLVPVPYTSGTHSSYFTDSVVIGDLLDRILLLPPRTE